MPEPAEKFGSGMMSSNEWANQQRDKMIQQRETMVKQAAKISPPENRDYIMQPPMLQSPNYREQKSPFIMALSESMQKPPHMMMQGMGGGSPFGGNMVQYPFEKKPHPQSANRSQSPMNYHPFGVQDVTPPESPRYAGASTSPPSSNDRIRPMMGW